MTLQNFAKLLTTSTTQNIFNVEIVEDENSATELTLDYDAVNSQDPTHTRRYDIDCTLDKLCLTNVILKNVNIRFKQRIELSLVHCEFYDVKLFDDSRVSEIALYNYTKLTKCAIHSFDDIKFYYATIQHTIVHQSSMLRIFFTKLDECTFIRCLAGIKFINSIFTKCQFAICTFKAYETSDVTFDNCEYNMSPCFYLHCPETGSYVAYKKASSKQHVLTDFCIIKLLIPEDAKRSSSISSKCRASKAVVLDIFDISDESKHLDTAYSIHNADFVYHVNDTVEVKHFEENRWEECTTGIHHFLTKQEAIDYSI